MSQSSDLSKSPYYDTSASMPNYYRVLFKPAQSVQTRELNELQAILQKQIEKFGDNIFQHGTIIDGCNFIFSDAVSYVKIKDLTTRNTTALVSQYLDKIVRNETTGLAASVIMIEDGYESNDPDLKTLYLQYLTSGSNGSVFSFTSGDTLVVDSPTKIIQAVDITNGGSGFSNSDTVIVTSAVVVNVATGTFTNGEYVTNESGNLQIVAIDSTTLANTNQVILSLKPRTADLANATFTVANFNFSNNEAIRNVSNTVTATIEKIIGSGLRARVTTNNVGRVNDVEILEAGERYTTVPTVTVSSANNTTGIGLLDLAPRTTLAGITVASTANAVGKGYAFGVTSGVIFQKGFFIQVDPQTVIVEKYHTNPNAVCVGFDTTEALIDSNRDDNLLDNAETEKNYQAPGADRLKLTPVLTVKTTDEASGNNDFLAIVEWSEGQPFRQKQGTQYSKINDEMARRTNDASGNFVIDSFLATTRSPANSALEANTVSLVIDPGTAYIDGYRVITTRNYVFDVDKGVDSEYLTNQNVSLFYGNYIEIKEFGGTFQFSTGDSIDLYNTAKGFISNTSLVAAGNTNPVGTKIGTANIRSLQKVDQTNYRLYLFNITMNAGKNFRDVKSVYYNGTKKGIADVVQQYDSTLARNVTVLREKDNDTGLLFTAGVESMKNANNIVYEYYTVDQTISLANSGIMSKDLSASPNEFFPYSATLSTDQLRSLQIVPTSADLILANSVTGTASVASGNTVTGSGTAFLTEVRTGDYIQVYSNGTANEIRRVSTIANNTYLTLDKALTFANTTAVLYRAFPKNVQIPIGWRSGITANNNANNNVLTIDLGNRILSATAETVSLSTKIQRNGATNETKTANRNKFVKIRLANNAGGTNGPWCIGVPDAFRLRNVYVGNSTVDTTANNKITNFYIDHNQTKDYYGLSYLYLKPKNNASLTSSDYLLVEFDYFTNSGAGYYNALSYVSSNVAQRYATDSANLASLTTTINSFEVPEVVDGTTNYDLLSYFDFRPYAANTAAPAASAGSAPLNPSATLSFGNTASPTNDKKFPVPATIMTGNFEHFIGRIESVYVNKEGKILSLPGKPGPSKKKLVAPEAPAGTMSVADLYIPPYPNLPMNRSDAVKKIIDTNVINIRRLTTRLDNKTIQRINLGRQVISQPKAYTMADIGKLERRLSDVEQYVRMSLLESDLTKRNIPSSSDRSLNRFKYGFFVDDYTTYNNLDRENPGFQAMIEEDDLVPEKITWMINFEPIIGPGGYIDDLLIDQNRATVAANTPTPNCIPDTLVANTVVFRAAPTNVMSLGGGNSNNALLVQSFTLASAQSAPATLYFSALNKNMFIGVYQGSVSYDTNQLSGKTLIASTSGAVALSTAEKTKVQGNDWYNWLATSYFQDVAVTGDYAKYVGKLSWNHNPTNGRGYTIIAYSAESGTHQWRYAFEYPIDRDTVGCPPDPTVDPPPPIVVVQPTEYDPPDRDTGVGNDPGGWG